MVPLRNGHYRPRIVVPKEKERLRALVFLVSWG